MDEFDIKLGGITATNAFVKTGLRDRSSDIFSDHSPSQIVSAETKSLKSAGRASEICSVLTAYRLLDIMYALEHPDDAMKAPQHQRLRVNFASFRVATPFLHPDTVIFTYYKNRFRSHSQTGRLQL